MASTHSGLHWFGFAALVCTLVCIVIAFASPYWLQTYPGSMNQFRHLGLWEICMDQYMHHKDDSMEVYNGCFWVFDRATKYWKLRDWILRPWFIVVEVIAGGNLIVTCVVFLLMVPYFLRCIPENLGSCMLMASSVMCYILTVATFLGGVLFGYFCQDWEWMPRPDLNFLSWSYGFYMLHGIFALAAAVALSLAGKREVREYREKVDLNMRMYGGPQSMPMQQYAPSSQYPPSQQYSPTSYSDYPYPNQPYSPEEMAAYNAQMAYNAQADPLPPKHMEGY